MKKILLIACLTLFLTGCSTEYQLTINQNNIDEEIKVKNINFLSNEKQINLKNNFESATAIVDAEQQNYFYKFTQENDLFKLNHSFDLGVGENNFSNSYVITQCFSNATFKETEDYIYFRAAGEFLCMYDGSNIDLSITNNVGYVSQHNGIKVKNNTYSWNITPLTKDDVNFELMIMKDDTPLKNKESRFSNRMNAILIFSLTAAVVYLVKNYKKEEV